MFDLFNKTNNRLALALMKPERERSVGAVRVLAIFHSGVGYACFTYKHHMGSEPMLVHGILALVFAVSVTMMDATAAVAKVNSEKSR